MRRACQIIGVMIGWTICLWMKQTDPLLLQPLSTPSELIPLEYLDGAESILASRGKVPLKFATLSDLILIPGISDRLAAGLLSAKDQLIGKDDASGCEVLEHVHGIGRKTAEKICPYLDLSPHPLAVQLENQDY